MAFDISTAREETAQTTGFDISTATLETPYGPEETRVRAEIEEERGFDPMRALSQSMIGRMFGGQSPAERVSTARMRDTAPMGTEFARDLPEIGEAPELNELSIDSAKRGFAAGLITNEAELANALVSQTPGAEVVQDPEGRALVKFPSGKTYAVNKPGLSGQDFVQFATRALAFSPAGRAQSLLGAGVKSGLTESALQAAETGVGGEFSPGEIGLAAGLGAATKGVEDIARGAFRASQPAVPDEIVEAAKQVDVPLMTSDVIPPKTFASRMALQTGEKIPIAGTGGLREAQQEARIQAIDEIQNKYNQFSYPAIIDSLKAKKDKIKSAAGTVLQDTGRKLDEFGASVPFVRTNDAIEKARKELTKTTAITSEAARQDLQSLMTALEGPINFTNLKELRTAFREIVESTDRAERSQLTSRAKSLLKNVENAMGSDMRSFARQHLTPKEFDKWQNANQVYANEAQQLTKTRIKNVLDKGDFTPETVDNMLFSKKPSEVRALYKSLTNEGRQNARAAIISKVFNNLSGRVAGITPNSFATEMKKLGLQTGEFFKGEEKKALDGLVKVLDATRRAQDAAVTTQTGLQVLGIGTLGSLATNPWTTLGTGAAAGTFARLYESPVVRNALLRVNSAKKGSKEFDQAIKELNEIMTPIAQSLRSQQQN